MFRKAWDQRYVVVKDGKLAWYKDKPTPTTEPQGVIDFRVTPCEAVPEPANKSQFLIRPKVGNWTGQAFKGSEDGREFIFDTTGSPQSFKAWLDAINAHCEFATRMSGGSQGQAQMSASKSLRR